MAQAPNPQAKTTGTANANAGTAPRSFMKDDFPIIRAACLRLFACVLVGTLMVGASHYFMGQQLEKKAKAQAELRELKQKLSSATNEKNEILGFQPKYLRLARDGFVGEEKRLDFVEHVRFIQQERQLLPLSYEIFPQQVVQLDPSIDTGELELRASRVSLKMALLHELDLLNFLQDISTKGRLIPQSCSIRANDLTENVALFARQQGECSMAWLTVGRRVAPDAATPAPAH